MTTFLNIVHEYIIKNHLLENDKKVLVALSGGADSVSLLLLLLDLGYPCTAVHCNFHLRGDESMRDEKFVRDLCREKGVRLEVRDFDVPGYMKAHGVSLEMACRELRYGWFEQLRGALDCQAIAVAHHRDDNIETFFLNAVRGSGIAGLAGMRPRNGYIVRPLLCVSRIEIEDYLKSCGRDFVVDSTNFENDTRRNQLRNAILPVFDKEFPGFRETLSTTLSNTGEGLALYRELVGRTVMGLCEKHENGFDIDYHSLMSYQNAVTLLFEILKPLGFNGEQCHEVIIAAQSENGVGKRFDSSSHSLFINRTKLEVLLHEATLHEEYRIKLIDNEIQYPCWLQVERVTGEPFDMSRVDGKRKIALHAGIGDCENLLVRRWREGDRFHPFGMKGSKLVSDLFTDLKLGEREKRSAWILEAGGKIVWVVGYRAAHLYRVTPDCRDYFLLSLH